MAAARCEQVVSIFAVQNSRPFPGLTCFRRNALGRGKVAFFPGCAPLYLLVLSVVLSSPVVTVEAQSAPSASKMEPGSTYGSPEITTQLVNLVQGYVAAGEMNNPATRGNYFAPKLFYYGHSRTRQQAIRELASLYQRWPQRRFVPTDSIELYKIPNYQGAYRVTALYEYKFENLNEHLSGMSRLTFVVERGPQGLCVIGVDEKLIDASTDYQTY